jgi:hypothetical protein
VFERVKTAHALNRAATLIDTTKKREAKFETAEMKHLRIVAGPDKENKN